MFRVQVFSGYETAMAACHQHEDAQSRVARRRHRLALGPVAAPGPCQIAKQGDRVCCPTNGPSYAGEAYQRQKVRPNFGAAGPDRRCSGSRPFREQTAAQ